MLKKDITFIYMDSAERQAYQPIAEEAKKRGYQVRMTEDKFTKCEIGFYCQHINFPQYSKFSVIMLHDIIQQYGNWPDIWFFEPWNIYDIGILPSDQWEKNWSQSSQWFYSRPRKGMYKVGWPKADAIAQLQADTYRDEFYEKYGLDINKKTVLYAPAWENDGKQDDFVQAMLKLDVNILIKQADWNKEQYPVIYQNCRDMEELHKNTKGVTILPPSTNIFVAIAVSDILVSEESSTMCEAAMMGIPAISVSNWLIPDVTPSRLPKCDYDFVIETTKEELKDCTENILNNYESFQRQSQEFAEKSFLNIGSTSSIIMDIVDDCVEGREIRYPQLKPNSRKKLSLKRYLQHRYIQLRRNIAKNYSVRMPVFRTVWKVLRSIKAKLSGSKG